VLVSPSSFGQCGEEPNQLLRENGWEIVNNPFGRKLTPVETVDLARQCQAIIAGVETYDREVLNELPDLRCISRVGVGMDSIDLDYALELGLNVRNTPDGPTQAVAELSIALAFDLLRKISLSDRNIRRGTWKKAIGNLIGAQTIGILGLGQIGKKAALLFQKFGCGVIAHDAFPDLEWMSKHNVANVDLDSLLKNSNVLCIHVSGQAEGTALLGETELNKVKRNLKLVNLSRGGVVDESALYEFLTQHEDAGAAVDVFKQEPYSGALADLENTVLTPHLGSYAKEAKLRMECLAVENMLEEVS